MKEYTMYYDKLIHTEELENRVNRNINEKDNMYSGNTNHYFGCGKDALKLIVGFLTTTRREEPKTILDFACGYGRVARYIRAAFPNAELVVSDTNHNAVDFCAKEFNAIPKYSMLNLDEIHFDKKFDLIGCGSLITHLEEHNGKNLLHLFNRHLEDNGIAVFTFHGGFVADRWKKGSWGYKIKEAEYKAMSEIYHSGKYAFANYEGQNGYGISITPLQWYINSVEEISGLNVLGWLDRGWDKHQDALCISKTI